MTSTLLSLLGTSADGPLVNAAGTSYLDHHSTALHTQNEQTAAWGGGSRRSRAHGKNGVTEKLLPRVTPASGGCYFLLHPCSSVHVRPTACLCPVVSVTSLFTGLPACLPVMRQVAGTCPHLTKVAHWSPSPCFCARVSAWPVIVKTSWRSCQHPQPCYGDPPGPVLA